MQPNCLILNLSADKIEDAKTFLRALDNERRPEYARSQARIGIVRETWFCVETGNPMLIATIEAPDFGAAIAAFSASNDPFDMWFKAELANCTGFDLNAPPPVTLPTLLSHFVA